jgi:hypothetical protein
MQCGGCRFALVDGQCESTVKHRALTCTQTNPSALTACTSSTTQQGPTLQPSGAFRVASGRHATSTAAAEASASGTIARRWLSQFLSCDIDLHTAAAACVGEVVMLKFSHPGKRQLPPRHHASGGRWTRCVYTAGIQTVGIMGPGKPSPLSDFGTCSAVSPLTASSLAARSSSVPLRRHDNSDPGNEAVGYQHRRRRHGRGRPSRALCGRNVSAPQPNTEPALTRPLARAAAAPP